MEKKWTWEYLYKLDDFVKTINTRLNRTTGMPPYKVTKKDEARIVGEAKMQSEAMRRKAKFKPSELVRISRLELPFKKGYQQNYSDEVFKITKVATLTPPTYHLEDSSSEKIHGKFYKQELVKFLPNE